MASFPFDFGWIEWILDKKKLEDDKQNPPCV